MFSNISDSQISVTPPFSLKGEKASKCRRKRPKLKAKDRVLKLLLNPNYEGKGISFAGIAQRTGLKDRRYAAVLVHKLEAEGMILIEHTSYTHPRMPNAKCCGKNVYLPGPNAKKLKKNKPLNYDTNITKNSSKEEFAITKAEFSFSTSSGGHKTKKSIKSSQRNNPFKQFDLEKHFPYKPHWWFKDIPKLQAALNHLKKKLSENFHVRNFVKFFSHLLAHGVFGYRRHCARNLSLAVIKPTLKRVEPMFTSQPITAGYEALVALCKKHGLDMSFTNIQRLMRKGFAHLAIASQAVLKRLEIGKVRDINAFMHFVVSMKEPYDLLKPKTSTG